MFLSLYKKAKTGYPNTEQRNLNYNTHQVGVTLLFTQDAIFY